MRKPQTGKNTKIEDLDPLPTPAPVQPRFFYVTITPISNMGLVHPEVIDTTPICYVLDLMKKTHAVYVILHSEAITEDDFKAWKKIVI